MQNLTIFNRRGASIAEVLLAIAGNSSGVVRGRDLPLNFHPAAIRASAEVR